MPPITNTTNNTNTDAKMEDAEANHSLDSESSSGMAVNCAAAGTPVSNNNGTTPMVLWQTPKLVGVPSNGGGGGTSVMSNVTLDGDIAWDDPVSDTEYSV